MLDLATADNMRLVMGLTFFPIGLLSTLAGLVMLVAGPYRREAQALAAHSARLSQKGLTGDIAAIAQSATGLINAVNDLIRTSSGNAIVLVGVGMAFEAAAYGLLIASAA